MATSGEGVCAVVVGNVMGVEVVVDKDGVAHGHSPELWCEECIEEQSAGHVPDGSTGALHDGIIPRGTACSGSAVDAELAHRRCEAPYALTPFTPNTLQPKSWHAVEHANTE